MESADGRVAAARPEHRGVTRDRSGVAHLRGVRAETRLTAGLPCRGERAADIEGKIEALFEGVFGRAFRTHAQPVELARKLAKEMDDHRTVSVSRVYVPNEYTIYLSPQDREQFESYESSLLLELQDYLAEQARRERYALLTPPKVKMETDDDLDMGEFGIATRMVQPKGAARPEEGTPAPQSPARR